MAMSNAAIDRLGDRLRGDYVSDDDVSAYHQYRSSFQPAMVEVQHAVRDLGLPILGQTARLKTIQGTISKLRRGSGRLSRMQDIAGCRVTVRRLSEQDSLLAAVLKVFPGSRAYDLRDRPRFGYRALHAVINVAGGGWVELQIRTSWQDTWANLSERAADLIGEEVKYGGGPVELREHLLAAAGVIFELDQHLERSGRLRSELTSLRGMLEANEPPSRDLVQDRLHALEAEVAADRHLMAEVDVKIRAFAAVYTRMVLEQDP
jgi:putative GTP pyrophosphokinase